MVVDIDFKELENKDIVLVIAPDELITQTFISILSYFVNIKDSYCIYVTINKPYTTLVNILHNNNIKTDKMFFFVFTLW